MAVTLVSTGPVHQAEKPRQLFQRRRRRPARDAAALLGAVAEFASPKTAAISSRTKRCASTGSIFQMVGQGESTSTNENPRPFTWFSMARFEHLGGVHDLLVVAQRHALDEDRRFQRVQQLADMQRVAFVQRVAAEAAKWCVFLPSGVVGAICPPVMP